MAINPTPANEEDILLTDDDYAALEAYLQTGGFVDAGILAAVAAAKTANLAVGASAANAYAVAQNLDAPPVITHNGLNYGVDATATPPILVVVTPIPASSIPIPATPPVNPPAT